MQFLSGDSARLRRRATDAAPGGHLAVRPLPPVVAWSALALFVTVIGAHALGIFGTITYPIVILGGVAGAVVGIRRNRPDQHWPWWILVATGLVWTAAGITAEVADTSGNLGRDRSLLPDLFAVPGYLMYGTALVVLYRARRPHRERDTLLDGLMLATGAALVVHQLVIQPALGMVDSWLPARVVVASYPALSLCLLAIAGRLAFAGGERNSAFSLLLFGTTALLVGDVVYAFGEIGRIDVPAVVLEIPYLLVPASIGAAVLHPAIRFVALPDDRVASHLGPGRLAAVALALFVPIVILSTGSDGQDRRVTIALAALLTATAVIRIVTAMRAQAASELELYHQATHDELTGLANRALLADRATALMSDAEVPGIALLFLDIDQFKFVNDSMGHTTGDELLVLVAERTLSCVREHDMVGRMSGDEFVIVAAHADVDAAVALGDRIRRSIRRPFQLQHGEVFVTASVGIAVAPHGARTGPSELFQQADTAMYRSKDAGRDTTTVFDASMRDGIARRLDLERSLRGALDRGELTVAFQPIVSNSDGRIRGMEALVRWSLHGRAVSPAEFVPIAEESGLIVPLGSFVLDESCRQLAWWRTHVPGAEHLTVSVNISARQVRASDIVDSVADSLERHGLPPEALWLEITESLMMEDALTTIAVMSGLRDLGVRLAVDDFGTGYSSLSYLKRFPVSRVKIDRSFVSGLGEQAADTSLVAAIVAMAQALGLEPVAEGVETTHQATILAELGCDLMQGYLFSAAVPADEVPAMFAPRPRPVRHRPTAARRCAADRRR